MLAATLKGSRTGGEISAPAELDFDEVYARHFTFACRSLRLLGVEPDALEDAAQDVFGVVSRRLASFEPNASVQAWIFAIRRVAANHRRSHRRKRDRLDPLGDTALATESDPDAHAEGARLARLDPVARPSARDAIAREAAASGPLAPAEGMDALAPAVTCEPNAASVEPSAPSDDARETPRPRASSHRAALAPASGTRPELSLLARAERAVRAKNPQLALALIGSFDELRPGAALNEERNAIELMARCEAGDASSPALKQAFAKRDPQSVYVERIEGECASQAAVPVTPTRTPAPDINRDEGGNHAQSETH